MKQISQSIKILADDLENELAGKLNALKAVGSQMIEVTRGQRMADLALNAVELIDRNLYERTCDVRWWATDSAIVDVLHHPSTESINYACKRLSVILDAYTVYLDIWIADASGTIIANGRPMAYPNVKGVSVASEKWFTDALKTKSGDEYTVAKIKTCSHLQDATVATYATAIRSGGESRGDILGVLGIHFDWGPQAKAIVKGVRLNEQEEALTRVMLLDSQFNVIASNDGIGILSETFQLKTQGQSYGYYRQENGSIVGFSLTPGYETYKGMGWYGCIEQKQFNSD